MGNYSGHAFFQLSDTTEIIPKDGGPSVREGARDLAREIAIIQAIRNFFKVHILERQKAHQLDSYSHDKRNKVKVSHLIADRLMPSDIEFVGVYRAGGDASTNVKIIEIGISGVVEPASVEDICEALGLGLSTSFYIDENDPSRFVCIATVIATVNKEFCLFVKE